METYTPQEFEKKFGFEFQPIEGLIGRKTWSGPKNQMFQAADVVLAPDGGWTVHLLGTARMSVRIAIH